MRADHFIASLGYDRAFRVGGSVRDELLGRKPKDADYVIQRVDLADLTIAVAKAGAKPSKLKLRDGRQAGVRAAVRGLGLIEIMLPRTEVSTGPGHHDFEIVVKPDLPLAEDAVRRDFTINALYRNVHTKEVLDPLMRGSHDLEDKLLNVTHPDSFRDDPLRILRALRFVSVLPGFDLGEPTYRSMDRYAEAAHGLTDKGVSGTALDEICKLLMGRRPGKALRYMRDAGVMAVLLPELEPMLGFEQESRYHDMTTDEHTFVALDAAAGMHVSLRVRLALLFHDSGKPDVAWKGDDDRMHYYAMPQKEQDYRTARLITIRKESLRDHEEVGMERARAALTRLNTPKRLRNDVLALVERHMVPISGKVRPAKIRQWRTQLGDDLLADLLKHRLCDVMGKGTVDYEAVTKIAKMEEVRAEAERRGVPANPKDLAIGGKDLVELGLKGPAIGRVQRKLLHEVVSQPDGKDRDWLLKRAATIAKKELA